MYISPLPSVNTVNRTGTIRPELIESAMIDVPEVQINDIEDEERRQFVMHQRLLMLYHPFPNGDTFDDHEMEDYMDTLEIMEGLVSNIVNGAVDAVEGAVVVRQNRATAQEQTMEFMFSVPVPVSDLDTQRATSLVEASTQTSKDTKYLGR